MEPPIDRKPRRRKAQAEVARPAPPEASDGAHRVRDPLSSAVRAAAGLAASAAETVGSATADSVSAVATTVGDVVERVEERVEEVGNAVGSRARPLVADVAHEVGDVARGARRLAQRASASRRQSRTTKRLPSLYRIHPEARNAQMRERGLRVVPLDEIAGTTVDAVPRGPDFLPLGPSRTPGWEARWQRIQSAIDRLVTLPPVDLLRYGGRYWVVDGHNRIAAAHRVGQLDVDANVIDLDPGPATPIAAYLGDSSDLRAVGSGRRLHRHGERDPAPPHEDER